MTHVAEVLCHRTADEGSPAVDVRHVQAALTRRNEEASVTVGPAPGTFRLRRPSDGRVGVSILIPFRDEPRLLRTCVDSVTATTRGEQVELVLIDNGSSDPETLTLVEQLEGRTDVGSCGTLGRSTGPVSTTPRPAPPGVTSSCS